MMYVAYCKGCLPTKLVVAWSTTEEAANAHRHSDHEEAEGGHFSMSESEWVTAYVLGDVAQTAANIIANHADRFV